MISKKHLKTVISGLNMTVTFIKNDKTLTNREKSCSITGVLYGCKIAFEAGEYPEEIMPTINAIQETADSLFG